MSWADLVAQATIGTTNRALPQPQLSSTTGDVAANLTSTDTTRVLELAAIEHTALRAGALAPRLEGRRPIPRAPVDPRPEMSHNLAATLNEILSAEPVLKSQSGRYAEMRTAALRACTARGTRPPYRMLRDVLVFDDSGELCGPRGRWLHERTGRYAHAYPPPAVAESWPAELESEVRVNLFTRLRFADPDGARELVARDFAGYAAETRADLVRAFGPRLGPGDADFLTGCLHDRATAVRDAAVEQLFRMSGSSLLTDLVERADAWLRFTPGSRIRRRAPRLELDVSAATRDALGEPVPARPEVRAEAAGRSLSLIPPAHWVARFGLNPDQLLNAVHGQEGWRLSQAWARATVLHQDHAWAEALFADNVHSTAAQILAPDVATPIALRHLEGHIDDVAAVEAALAHVPGPWPVRLCQRVMAWLGTRGNSFNWAGGVLLLLGVRATADADPAPWLDVDLPPEHALHTPAGANCRYLIHLRHRLHEELSR